MKEDNTFKIKGLLSFPLLDLPVGDMEAAMSKIMTFLEIEEYEVMYTSTRIHTAVIATTNLARFKLLLHVTEYDGLYISKLDDSVPVGETLNYKLSTKNNQITNTEDLVSIYNFFTKSNNEYGESK